MKKLLLALLAVTGFVALTPQAEAGQYARVYSNCGVSYVPKAVLYGRSYTDQVAYNNYYYGAPRRSYSNRSYSNRGYCAPRHSRTVYHSRSYRAPRIAFSFGY